MKFIIVLSVTLGCAFANYGGHFLADSPDVAAAKLAHFEEKAKAAAAVGAAPDYVTSYYLNYYKNYHGGHSPAAAISVLPSGYLADTPEVASAKASFLAEHAKASYAARANSPATQAYNNDYNNAYTSNNYNNAPAAITVLPSGFLADTPEVAAAKTAHFAEQARAAYAAGASSTYAIPQTYNNDYYNAYTSNNAPAAISVLPSGYLADTPEVAAAKASFLAEHAKASYAARANSPATQAYNNDYYNAYTSNNNNNNAVAAITVLPSGFLADTPEVASAKTAHFAEQARAAYAAGASSSYAIPFNYNSAAINVLPSGYLADTPEVTAAKASFYAEFAKASSSSSASSNPYYSPYYTWNGYSWVANQ